MPPDATPTDWNAALNGVRAQMADYEREGTSTPGKLKRAARLRACRLTFRDLAPEHAAAVAPLKLALIEIEKAEKDDDWRRLAPLIQQFLAALDALLGRE